MSGLTLACLLILYKIHKAEKNLIYECHLKVIRAANRLGSLGTFLRISISDSGIQGSDWSIESILFGTRWLPLSRIPLTRVEVWWRPHVPRVKVPFHVMAMPMGSCDFQSGGSDAHSWGSLGFFQEQTWQLMWDLPEELLGCKKMLKKYMGFMGFNPSSSAPWTRSSIRLSYVSGPHRSFSLNSECLSS